jgi:isoquinoline 1-oxidoreductase beta subunit
MAEFFAPSNALQRGNEMEDSSISRRKFIGAGAALTFVILLDPVGCKRKVQQPQNDDRVPSNEQASVGAWVVLHADESVVIYNPAAEMGQGSMTALPLIVAEEMDADWDKVRIEHSPVEPDVYGRSWRRGGPGTMMTVGSQAVMGYFTKLRMAGAQIRRALLEMAARQLDVPVGELSTAPGVVIHDKTDRRVSYGELAATSTVPRQLPELDESHLKSPDDFRLIGTSVPRRDVPPKTDGSAQFAIDLQLPDMLIGMIQRAPVHNGRPTSHNAEEVRAMPGVTTTVELDHGVGVVGTSTEAVLAAKRALEIQWEEGNPAAGFNSEKALAGYPSVLDDDDVDARTVVREGDADDAVSKAARSYRADFFADHVYHAQMEPLNAVVHVKESGDAEVWIGTQGPGVARSAVARVLGIDTDRVTMHRTYLGGGFGRRSSDDYVVEATHLSNAVKRPVKLLWTREDDIHWGKFRPMCFQRLTAGVDEEGKLTGWTHRIVGDGGGLLTSGIEIPFYDIPGQTIELKAVDHGVRLHFLRSVGHPVNKFAIESFLDEIAAGEDIDPLQLRRTLLKGSPRALKVVNTVATMANWGDAPEGRARGICFGERSRTFAAGIAEISVDEKSGRIRVHRFWAAIDAGIIVQPDNARAQIEGSIVMGLSTTLSERVTFENGRVQQSNYNDYSIMRMSEAPEIEVQFIDSGERPTGIGEPGVPITCASVANAFFALTGERLRHLPFTPDRVTSILGNR